MCVLAALLAATSANAAVISVGDSDFNYGHNGSSGRTFTSADTDNNINFYFNGGRGFLSGAAGVAGATIYKYVADEGCTIESVDLSATFYLAGNSAAWVWASKDGTNWTNLWVGQSWSGGTNTGLLSYEANSQAVYVKYSGRYYTTSPNWQLTADNLDFTVVPEPATMGLLGFGGLVALFRKKR